MINVNNLIDQHESIYFNCSSSKEFNERSSIDIKSCLIRTRRYDDLGVIITIVDNKYYYIDLSYRKNFKCIISCGHVSYFNRVFFKLLKHVKFLAGRGFDQYTVLKTFLYNISEFRHENKNEELIMRYLIDILYTNRKNDLRKYDLEKIETIIDYNNTNINITDNFRNQFNVVTFSTDGYIIKHELIKSIILGMYL